MTGMKTRIVFATALAVGLAFASTGTQGTGQQSAPRMNDQQLKTLVNRIDKQAQAFGKSVTQAANRSQIDDYRWNGEVNQAVTDFKQSARQLRDRVNRKQAANADVEDVLRRSATIDSFMRRYQLTDRAEQDWRGLRTDLDLLAGAHNLAWDWSHPGYATPRPGSDTYSRLTGTYQLEATRSDDPRRAADVAARTVPPGQQQRTYQSLMARLEAPEQFVIERRASSVTMSSTGNRPITVDADGRTRNEQWDANRTMTTRASIDGERLVVVTTGSRGHAYTATFEPMSNGGLRMTRTIDDEGLRQPVTVRSVYRRTSNQARWDIGGADMGSPDYSRQGRREGGVLDDMTFVAVLDRALSTSNAREGDVYTMTTQRPSQYEGAIIQGVVSDVNESGRMTGRAGMTLNLQSIRLRDGRVYDFDGMLEEVRTPGGENVRLDREGGIDSNDSQTQKTVQRSAIGAALGALIGAVTGGGKGAAIGAAVGAGGGAGTVMIEGRDRLDLQRGTQMTISSSGPGRLRTGSGDQR